MAMWIKQSTAITVKLGPFVDDTDGKTAETGLTISQADVRLSKNGGDIAQKNESSSATHDELGYYDVALNTTDTNTLGRLRVLVSESGALPVWADYMVVPANVWDSLFGADKLQVHVDEMTAGIITATVIATDAIDADALASDAIAEINATVDTALADYDAPTKAELDSAVAPLATASALATVDTVVDTIASAVDTEIPAILAAVDTEVAAIKAKTDNLPASPAATGDIPTAAENADAVWEEAIADHSGTSGSTAEALNAAGAAGDPWSTQLPGAYGAGSAGKIIGDNINATVSSRATQTSVDDLPTNAELATALGTADDAVLAAIAALNNLSAADVNAEVDAAITDAALATAANLATVAGYLDTEIAAILADTNELQTDWANGGRLDLLLDAIKAVTDALPDGGALTTLLANVAAILADTGTDGVVLSTATRQAIADEVLGRSIANTEDSAGVYTLTAMILAAFESSVAGTTWTINKTDGSTQFATRTVTTDDTAEPVIGVS